jgi:Zn-dependent protease
VPEVLPTQDARGLPPGQEPWVRVTLSPPPAPRYRLASLLFLLTAFTSTTLGGVVHLATRTDTSTDLLPFLGPTTLRQVWADPELIRLGLSFSLPLLFILLCHELGHYIACLRLGIPATPPFFLPAPFFIGTFGAFIRIRGRVHDRDQLFDVGIAGPIAGFVALLPFLLLGVAWSQPGVIHLADGPATADALLYRPGSNLALTLVGRIFHPGADTFSLDLHPFALAAWVGLLATALNLLPLGQLDGGHVLYSFDGRAHRLLSWPLWFGLLLMGTVWQGWWVWCVLIFFMGLRHPPLGDDDSRLSPGRRRLALVGPLLLVLSFTPEPLAVLLVRDAPGLLAALR